MGGSVEASDSVAPPCDDSGSARASARPFAGSWRNGGFRRLNEEGDGGEIGQEPGGEGGTEGGGDDEGAGGAEGSPESFGRLLSWPSGPSGPGGGSSMSSSLSLSGSSGAATPRLPSA